MIVNILIDFETAAKSERAAILSIGAVPFVLPSENILFIDPVTGGNLIFSDVLRRDCGEFFTTINATSCVMEGMEFDQDTVNWWSRQSPEAKSQFSSDTNSLMNVEQAFIALINFIRSIKQKYECDICIWTQGTDFDIPKLRYCCTRIAEISEDNLPWRYNAVRDARTYVLEGLALLFGRKPVKEAYKDIPDNPEAASLVTHDVLSDCYKSIWSVTQVNQMLMQAIREKQE